MDLQIVIFIIAASTDWATSALAARSKVIILTTRRDSFMIPLMKPAPETTKHHTDSPGPAARRLARLIWEGWRADLVALRNWWRKRRRSHIDYIVMELGGPLPERAPGRRSFIQRLLPLPPRPLSVQTLNARLQRIADDEGVRGVVLILRDFSAPGLARLQNIRRSLLRFKESDKQLVIYTPYLDLAHYYVAGVADHIVAPSGANFDVLGMHSEALFLRDALHKIGLEAEVLQVSPYKTAGNAVGESQITPEQRQQMEWLIDDAYDALTADLAADRGISQETLQRYIDEAPYSVQAARERGLLDSVAYEDELPVLLAQWGDAASSSEQASGSEDAAQRAARLAPWDEAAPQLLEKVRHPAAKAVGVIAIEGAIVMGPSRQPPVNLPIPFIGGAMAGEESLIQQLRKAAQDNSLGALVVHVDSGGGSALASELIRREMAQVTKRKPVVAYMGNVAASGGYFVSAGANRIMSQRSTITGSIGVLTVHMSTSELLKKAHINRTGIKRGKHADLYTDPRPLTVDERAVLWSLVQDTYEQFKNVVADARGLDVQQVEQISGGRVWTGRQALERRLVDSHGDFQDAVQLAAELAGIPFGDGRRLRVKNVGGVERYAPPHPAATVAEIAEALSLRQLHALNGKVLALTPLELRIR